MPRKINKDLYKLFSNLLSTLKWVAKLFELIKVFFWFNVYTNYNIKKRCLTVVFTPKSSQHQFSQQLPYCVFHVASLRYEREKRQKLHFAIRSIFKRNWRHFTYNLYEIILFYDEDFGLSVSWIDLFLLLQSFNVYLDYNHWFSLYLQLNMLECV